MPRWSLDNEGFQPPPKISFLDKLKKKRQPESTEKEGFLNPLQQKLLEKAEKPIEKVGVMAGALIGKMFNKKKKKDETVETGE